MDFKNILHYYSLENCLINKPFIWIIFGAGERGRRLLNMLEKQNLEIDYFCDNSIQKQGLVIDGIPCVGIENLTQDKEKYCIMVSPFNGEEIVEDLKKRGFPNVVSPKAIEQLVFWEKINYLEDRVNIFPYGHFYSLYPNIEEIKQKESLLFSDNKSVVDIDLNEDEQIRMLLKMRELYSAIPKWEDISVPAGTTRLRYRFGNLSLSPGDAIGLHCMLRILKPKRMIEVGSGYTSAVTLDTNEFYLDNSISLMFIEPYPSLLQSLLTTNDKIDLLPSGLQEIPLSTFEQLEAGDILFIDSTHVSKIGSDVNYLFFDILPRLKSGVYIHLHDIFYPFEYPKDWIYNGMIWNELYLLRAFLQNNKEYEIVFFQNMMEKRHMDVFVEKWPLDTPVHGGSIWIRKKLINQ
ncbi:MAG: hypothetical protein ACYDEX_11360 [Mobilitalea sp.]